MWCIGGHLKILCFKVWFQKISMVGLSGRFVKAWVLKIQPQSLRIRNSGRAIWESTCLKSSWWLLIHNSWSNVATSFDRGGGNKDPKNGTRAQAASLPWCWVCVERKRWDLAFSSRQVLAQHHLVHWVCASPDVANRCYNATWFHPLRPVTDPGLQSSSTLQGWSVERMITGESSAKF